MIELSESEWVRVEICWPSLYSVSVLPEPTIVRVVKPGFRPPPAGIRVSPLLLPFLTRIAAST
jgi:hypothetical protein